ncbi:MAG: crossover junction endodeoxyribonuclease RuvC [Anaerolineaceae bacterium]|nr:crossover junction endodeoxyribonuclease RuvC [Anaerolineaceae bacterium]MBN2677219.1 crossover junction endodeoxyribonuclease RuvC [Anaerolineaceae bacterium]
MLVLGIDPGTASTGYGLVVENEAGGLQAVSFGVIKTPPELDMPSRLQCLYQNISELINLHQPQYGAVEKLFFQRNVSTAITVGQARGVVLLAFADHGLPVAEYTPLEIKKAATGYGSAEKKQVQSMIKALLHLDRVPQPDDAADALAVALCHINSHRYRNLGVS